MRVNTYGIDPKVWKEIAKSHNLDPRWVALAASACPEVLDPKTKWEPCASLALTERSDIAIESYGDSAPLAIRNALVTKDWRAGCGRSGAACSWTVLLSVARWFILRAVGGRVIPSLDTVAPALLDAVSGLVVLWGYSSISPEKNQQQMTLSRAWLPGRLSRGRRIGCLSRCCDSVSHRGGT